MEKLKKNLFNKINLIKSDYPVAVVENFINKKNCFQIIKEIDDFNKFDDRVMVSRNRINKGSENFKKFIQNSNFSKKLFNQLNNMKSFKKMRKALNLDNSKWIYSNRIDNFSKTNFGLQKTNFINFIKESYQRSPLSKSLLNLDVDFSIAENGYYREAHRDRDNRIINFLLYFNNVSKKSGGSFNICKLKKKYSDKNQLKRFPNKKEIQVHQKIFPKTGTLVIFLSSPNSYHEAGKFISKYEKRFFMYGSYSLNKKIIWSKK